MGQHDSDSEYDETPAYSVDEDLDVGYAKGGAGSKTSDVTVPVEMAASNLTIYKHRKCRDCNIALDAQRSTLLALQFFHPSRGGYRAVFLFFVSMLMVGSYFAYDSISALSPELEKRLWFSDADIGLLYSIYAFPNIIMVLFGGMIVDRLGTNASSVFFSSLIVLGALILVSGPNIMANLTGGTVPFLTMLFGRFIFGIGSESMIVCQNSILTKWFNGKELALSFSITLTFARIGSVLSLIALPSIQAFAGYKIALWVTALMCVLSFSANIIVLFLEKKALNYISLETERSDKFSVFEMLHFPPSFWLISMISFFFYGSVLPFTSFGVKFFITKYHMSNAEAGAVVSIISFSSMIFSPIFGFLIDKKGSRLTFIIIGTGFSMIGFLVLALTDLNPIVSMIIIGGSFSLVPAALWPCVSIIIKPSMTGTAFGLMSAIQNFGLTLLPFLIGKLNDITGSYIPMCFAMAFMCFLSGLCTLALFFLKQRRLLQMPSKTTLKVLAPTRDVPLHVLDSTDPDVSAMDQSFEDENVL